MSTSKFRVLRTCEFCGKEFYAQKVSTRYCSKRCNELAYKQRRRQRQISKAEARVLQKPIEEVGNKEFLFLQDASVLFGITKRSVYNLIYNGVHQAFKFSSRMTFVRKADITTQAFQVRQADQRTIMALAIRTTIRFRNVPMMHKGI